MTKTLCDTELEGKATEADRQRMRVIVDDLRAIGCFRLRSAHCEECDELIEADGEDAHELNETEFAILRGLVAHRLAAEGKN